MTKLAHVNAFVREQLDLAEIPRSQISSTRHLADVDGVEVEILVVEAFPSRVAFFTQVCGPLAEDAIQLRSVVQTVSEELPLGRLAVHTDGAIDLEHIVHAEALDEDEFRRALRFCTWGAATVTRQVQEALGLEPTEHGSSGPPELTDRVGPIARRGPVSSGQLEGVGTVGYL